MIAIKNASGEPSSGMLNPQSVAATDTAIDLEGTVLENSPDAVDLEGIIKLSDGSFWLGDEMGPSVMHVSSDGRILKRYVPEDAAEDYNAADTEVMATLPAILSKRTPNRGIESMAVSPDEASLYFMLQNPLSNPDADTYKAAKNTRVFKMERETGELVGEYVYQLDNPRNFGFDDTDAQNAPRVSELTAIGDDRLLVLERTNKTTKLFEISLADATNILGTQWDDVATEPSLEMLNDLSSTEITPLSKILAFDTFEHFKEAPTKIKAWHS